MKRICVYFSVKSFYQSFIITIALQTYDFEGKKCVTFVISNEIKLKKTFVSANVSPQSPTDPNWSPLLDNRLSVYSGFLFKDSEVRIAAIVDQNLWSKARVRIDCLFKERANSSAKFKSMATLRVLAEHKFGDQQYAASEVKCPLPGRYHSVLKYVAISLGSDRHLLRLSKAQSYHSNQTSLDTVVCVRPVFQSTHLLSSVVEFLAYYRANKISKFIFYDLDMDEKLRLFLTDLEFVEIIPWKLSINKYLIHAFGQRAAIQDCLHRYSNSAIIFVDVDEFIVVQEKKTTIQSLIAEKLNDKTLSSLVINNRLLCHEFQTRNEFPVILSHNRIQTYSWRPEDRSKMIVLRPDTVIDAHIHAVTATQEGYHRLEMDDSTILLYHYRSCCGLNQEFVHLEHLNLYFRAISDKYVEDFRIKWFEREIYKFIDDYVIDYRISSNPRTVFSTDI